MLVSPLAYGNLEDHAESCNRFVRPGVCFFPPLLYAKVRKYMVAVQYVSPFACGRFMGVTWRNGSPKSRRSLSIQPMRAPPVYHGQRVA